MIMTRDDEVYDATEYILRFYKELQQGKTNNVVQGYWRELPHYLMLMPLLNLSLVRNDHEEIADCLWKIKKHNDLNNFEIRQALIDLLEYYFVQCMKR